MHRLWMTFALAGCDAIFGTDPEPVPDMPDAPVDAATGTPLVCTNLSPLPTTMLPSGVADTFAAGTSVLGSSAVTVGDKPLVVFDIDTSNRVIWADAPSLTSPIVGRGFVVVLDAPDEPEHAVVWRDPNGRLKFGYEVAGAFAIASAVTDGLDARWSQSKVVSLPVANAHLRSVAVGGRRMVIESDEPHAMFELERDPATDALTVLDTLGSINELADARHPSFSADGCRVVFERDPSTLAYADRGPDGRFGEPVQILTDAQPARFPSLSEDGNTLYFSRFSTQRMDFQLYVLQ